MLTFLLSALSWLSSSAFAGLANSVVSVINKKADTKVAINHDNVTAGEAIDLAQLNASVSKMHEDAALATLHWGWWGSRYMMMAAALPPIIHSGAVYLDSTFKFGWGIPRAPGVYEGQELSIIATVVGILTVQSIGGGIVSAITKRQ